VELAHVADVEEASGIPDCVVFVDDAGVLNGHLPSGERHEPRSERDVFGVERCPPQVGARHADEPSRLLKKALKKERTARTPGPPGEKSSGF
jgi:hypothetical protein